MIAVEPGRAAFLVVYAILWGAATSTFGRLNAFPAAAFLLRPAEGWARQRRRRACNRYLLSFFVANLLPLFWLAFIWWCLPSDHHGGVADLLGGAVAGVSATAFPRFLHGAIASNREWTRARYFSVAELQAVLSAWDRAHTPRPSNPINDRYVHLLGGSLHLAVYSLAGLGIAYWPDWWWGWVFDAVGMLVH